MKPPTAAAPDSRRTAQAAWCARRLRSLLAAFALVALLGCRTIAPLPPVDLSQPGWTVRTGQAVWRPQRGAPELAGDLLVAAHADGRTFAQFSKTPFPLVVAQTTPAGWQIHFAPNNRTLRAPGPPPPRFLWLHLAAALLNGVPPPVHVEAGVPPVEARASDPAPPAPPAGTWRWVNRATGETLEGFLHP